MERAVGCSSFCIHHFPVPFALVCVREGGGDRRFHEPCGDTLPLPVDRATYIARQERGPPTLKVRRLLRRHDW